MSRATAERTDELYKVDTVPPPPGEDDAYSAATKVGALAATTISQMLADAEAGEVSAPVSTPPRSGLRPSVPQPAAPMPKIWDEDEDGPASGLEPTGVIDVSASAPPPVPASARPAAPAPTPIVAPPAPTPPPATVQSWAALPLAPAPALSSVPVRRAPTRADVVFVVAITIAIVAGVAALLISFL